MKEKYNNNNNNNEYYITIMWKHREKSNSGLCLSDELLMWSNNLSYFFT